MLKPSDLGGVLVGLLIMAAIGGLVFLRVTPDRPPPPNRNPAAAEDADGCSPSGWEAAATANRASLDSLLWAPFGRSEIGWATYAPLIAREVGTRCSAGSSGFAQSYARWQAQRQAVADGVFKPSDFNALRDGLALRRPFVQLTAKGVCPAAAEEATLALAAPQEAYGGKPVRLRPGALAAYRRMVAAARREGVGVRPPLLTLVSGFRGPEEEAARCVENDCDTVARARCSAHRTGLALDLYLQPASGERPTSTADANRRHMAQSPEYRWLVANAAAFGFLPYAYEPWHWEWTGEPP